MVKRKTKQEPEVAEAEADEAEFDADEEEEKPKPKKSRPKKKPALTEPAKQEDGYTLHPPSLIYKGLDGKPSSKIAAFDFDGTLALTKSGAPFATNANDWKVYNSKVKEVVQKFIDDGYKFVIISNQGGIKSALEGKASEKARSRFDSLIKALGVEAAVLASTQDDGFRKPKRGMWDFFVENGNSGVAPDLEQSFYCGDASGRDGDFSDSDLKFAEGIGLPFKTPDDVFGAAVQGGTAEADEDASGPNAALVIVFRKLATHFKDDVFKARAYKNSAASLEEHPTEIKSGKEAGKLKGIGKGSVKVIDEVLETGKTTLLDADEIAKQEAAKVKKAEEAAGGDAFTFM